MTLLDLLPSLPLSYDYAKQYGLVFNEELADRLKTIQTEHPSQHVASPILLTDGRYLLCADLLTEVPDGIYGTNFQHLDQSRFNEIEVVLWSEIISLIPQPPEME